MLRRIWFCFPIKRTCSLESSVVDKVNPDTSLCTERFGKLGNVQGGHDKQDDVGVDGISTALDITQIFAKSVGVQDHAEANVLSESCTRTSIAEGSTDSHSVIECNSASCRDSAEFKPAATSAPGPILSSPYISARIESLRELRSEFDNELTFQIEASKSHWTELTEQEDSAESNREVYERLKNHPEWGAFFRREVDDLEIGEKIGEGGQAEVFAATGTLPQSSEKQQLVVKVFKQGYHLRDLQRLWPPELLKTAFMPPYDYNVDEVFKRLGFDVEEVFKRLGIRGEDEPRPCWAVGAKLMMDDRFAFVFPRHDGDLRKAIDQKILSKNNSTGPVFPSLWTYRILVSLAENMTLLHKLGIIHKDLKAANVLYSWQLSSMSSNGLNTLCVADFESSVGTVGTGFWRAPEILLALRNGSLTGDTFTPAADVYSFAMTCYEVLTGHLPFEGRDLCDYDVVILGERPALPDYIFPELKDLISRCWHSDPLQRPSFEAILSELLSFSWPP